MSRLMYVVFVEGLPEEFLRCLGTLLILDSLPKERKLEIISQYLP
jgi:hypothetical protein